VYDPSIIQHGGMTCNIILLRACYFFCFLSCIVLTFPNKYTNSDQKAQQSMIIVNWPRKSYPFMDHTVTECIVVLRVETESIAVQSYSFQSNCEMTLMLLTWTSATASRCFEPIASFLALNKTVVHMMLSDVSCHLCSWYACCVVRQSFGHHFKCIKLHPHPQYSATITYLNIVTIFLDTYCDISLFQQVIDFIDF
jgi:hypothetical protein